MISAATSELVDTFVNEAVAGESRRAVGIALELLDAGVSEDAVIATLLAPAQRLVGERWQRNMASVADEHMATGAAESALHALAAATAVSPSIGHVVVCCAEGDWHALAAHMIAEQLRARGVKVAYLGASTPAEHVARFIERQQPDALAISCNLPLFYAGVTRLADAAHALGVPVLAGGRAFDAGPHHALRLGCDAVGADASDALQVLAGWATNPPQLRRGPTPLDPAASEIDARAADLADEAFDDLACRFPAMAGYDGRQIARTREDLAFIARFTAAALLVDNDDVLTGFVAWLATVLKARGVPTSAVTAGLEALRPLLGAVAPPAMQLCDTALASIAE